MAVNITYVDERFSAVIDSISLTANSLGDSSKSCLTMAKSIVGKTHS